MLTTLLALDPDAATAASWSFLLVRSLYVVAAIAATFLWMLGRQTLVLATRYRRAGRAGSAPQALAQAVAAMFIAPVLEPVLAFHRRGSARVAAAVAAAPAPVLAPRPVLLPARPRPVRGLIPAGALRIAADGRVVDLTGAVPAGTLVHGYVLA